MSPPFLFMEPDWAMLGVKLPDAARLPRESLPEARVMVIASQTLTQAQLRAALEHDGWDLGRGERRPGSFIQSYEIQAFMRDVVIAYGADYAEAMRTIFERWTPDAAARSGLAQARPAAVGSGPAELMP